MHDYDEATIRGMRQILNDRERAKRDAERARPYVIVMHTPAFYEAGVRLPPPTWRQRLKAWIARLLRG